MKGFRRWIAGFVVIGAMAAPAAARAADCTLSGSGQEGPTDLSLYQAPDATLEASMIFVDFSDHPADPAETPPQNTIGPALRNWATSYFADVSGGRTSVDIAFDDQWVRMSQPAGSYNFQTFASQRAFIAEAIQKSDLAGFDFAGRQTVYVVAAPTGGVLPNSPAFIAFSNEAVVADGTAIRWGSSMGDDVRSATPNYGSHVLAHETGHTFGLPDLYIYSKPFAEAHLNAGAWDLMGWIGPGLGFNGWHRNKLGWLDPAQSICVDGEATATLTPMATPGGTKMLIGKTSSSTAYVAEVRAPGGVDAGMCDSGGVLIYRVDANAATGGPLDAGPIFVELSDPNDPGDPNDASCGALHNAPFGVGQTFTDGPITVEVQSGTPAAGFQVRMTAPATPDPPPTGPTGPTGPTDPVGSAQTGSVERKLRLDGKKRVVAELTCPSGATSCSGKLTLALRDETKLASVNYAVAPPGGDVPLNLKRKARKALAEAFGKKEKAKATATLDGATGKVTQKVKVLR
jgi:M6 family metalloprotease-like protein